jgi:NTP pyrophosphatase (non-canonical NTP hydrolase)
MGIEEFKEQLRLFVSEREWGQFHTPENLAKSISIEASELLECFQWSPNGDFESVKKELADVLTYAFLLSERLNLDPIEIMKLKLEETRAKYPLETSKGKSTKYDQL